MHHGRVTTTGTTDIAVISSRAGEYNNGEPRPEGPAEVSISIYSGDISFSVPLPAAMAKRLAELLAQAAISAEAPAAEIIPFTLDADAA